MNSYSKQNLVLFLVFLATLFLFTRGTLRAQESPVTLRGAVRAQRGAPIEGAAITIKNLETGQSHKTSSTAGGQFEIPLLEPGRYDLEVSRTGFVTRQETGVQLRAGQSVTLNLVLEPAREPSQAAPAFQINESLLVGLPLNGRSYTTLATLQSEVSDPFGASTPRGVGSGGLTVSGGRPTSNNFLLDGTNIMNTENRVPQSAAGVQLGADAVFQVQVFSGNYGADYGRSSGGVLNSITRSGTDEFHGTLFEYFRNSKLDARNFFDPGSEPPPFKRNQFGFAVVGPVRKDKTYFTVSYEGLRDRYTRTAVDYFPDALARQGIITDVQGNVIQTLTVHPKVKELLKIYPLPNSVPVGRGAAQNVSPQFLPTSENFFTTRLDHKISDEDSFFVRYSFDDAVSNFPDVSASHPFWTEDTTRQQYVTLVESHIFNPRLLNAFRFGYTRPVVERNSFSSIEIPRELFFVRDAPQFGQLFHVGATPFGLPSNTPEMSRMSTFQLADDLLTQRGPHGLKLGFEVHRYHWHLFSSLAKGAEWRFNSLESFLEGGPRGDTSVRVALPGSDDTMDYRQTLVGLYVQDAYQVGPRLLLTLGLRYELATLIHDKNGRTAFLADPLRDSATQIGPYLANNPSLRNFSPRVGFRWSPLGGQKTVLSGGFGIYYDQLLAYVVDQRKNTPPFYNLAARTNFNSTGTFPDAVAAATEGSTPLLANILDYQNTKTPTVLRYNFAIQQQLPGGWRVQASYLGARGNHLYRTYEANLFPEPIIRADGSLFFPPNAGPLNPAFGGGINVLSSDAQSFYNALQLSANKNFGQGISVQANYTYSKSIDDSSSLSIFFPAFGPRRTLDRSLSDFDIRHRLVANYFIALPFGKGQRWWKSGVLTHVFGGWRLGGILSFRSGVPTTAGANIRTPGYLFSTNRPNLRPGYSNNPTEGVSIGCSRAPAGTKLRTPELYWDPCVFDAPPPGTLGNVGRNTIISASVFGLDVSFQKDFLLDAKRRLQFRTEFFNLPNHTNFAPVVPGLSQTFSGFPARYGGNTARVQRTATTARQIQFALRLSF